MMMDAVFGILTRVQHEIGGGLVYLECEDKEALLSFYGNPQNRFIRFGERYSEKDRVRYIRMFRML